MNVLARLLACALLASCSYLGAATESRATARGSGISFVRPIVDGYEVVGLDGKRIALVGVGDRAWVSGLVPNLTGYYIIDIDGSRAFGRELLSLRIVSKEWGSRLVYSGEWARIKPGQPVPKILTWAADDGSAAFILADGKLQLWSRCSEPSMKTIIEKDIVAFDASSARYFYLTDQSSRVLYWRRVDAGGEGKVDLPAAFDVVWSGGDSDQALVGAHVPGAGDRLSSDFAIVDTSGGSAKRIAAPVDGQIFDLAVIEGKPEIVFEVWDGKRERSDGTELTDFYWWNYMTGASRRLLSNQNMYQIHQGGRDVFRAGLAACK